MRDPSRHSRPKADLYICEKCGELKPGIKFTRSNNKSGFVFSMKCNVCRRAETSKHNTDYYNKVRNDPALQLEIIRRFEARRPILTTTATGHDVSKYYKWLMSFNVFKARVGLIDKRPPFDIVAYVNRKVKYGRLSQEEAERRIESWYERHPESRPSTNS